MASCGSEKDRRHLVAILGPTACGKTSLALHLARHFGLDIVNCDSRQVYDEMVIGTAAPTTSEKAQAPHHLFARIKPDRSFSAGDYARVAQTLIQDLWSSGKIPLLVGGTGFYFEALTQGLPELEVDLVLRDRLQKRLETEGLEVLIDELRRLDPQGAQAIDTKNPRRVTRALEMVYQSGKSLVEARVRLPGLDAEVHPVLVSLPREVLHERISRRVQQMLVDGLKTEVRRLLVTYGPDAPGLKTIGYSEWTNFFAGSVTRDEVQEQIIIHTRQYAKRQETWFRNRFKSPPLDLAKPDTLPGIQSQLQPLFQSNRER